MQAKLHEPGPVVRVYDMEQDGTIRYTITLGARYEESV